MGLESGVNKRFGEAPIFYWLYTSLIAIGAGLVLLPGVPLIWMILLSQVLIGILLPLILIFLLLLVNRKDLMNGWTNSRAFNAVAWTTAFAMIGLSIGLAVLSF